MTRPRLLLLLPTATYRTTAFIEAARRLAVDLTIASERPATAVPISPEGFLILDLADPPRAAQQALAFHRIHPLAAALGVDDDTVIIATAINHALGVPANPPPAVAAARDKLQQRQVLAAAGVPVPAFTLLDADADLTAAARAAPYPCVLKPLRLSASRGVIRADTPAQFLAAARRIRHLLAGPDLAGCAAGDQRLLAEAFVPGPEVALEGILAGGDLQVLAVFDKPDPLDGPFFEETVYVTPSRLPPAALVAVERCAGAAVRALGLVEGPVHAELRFNTEGAWLIELAARPIGGRCSAALRFRNDTASADAPACTLEELIIRRSLGQAVDRFARESAASGVMMIPVPGVGILRSVQGIAAARGVPGVDDVVITATGQRLVPWPEGNRYPGFIFARGEGPEGVERALRTAHAALEFTLEPVD